MSFCISSLLALLCLVSVLLILVLISERGIDLHRPAPGRRVWWRDGLKATLPLVSTALKHLFGVMGPEEAGGAWAFLKCALSISVVS